MAGKLYLDAAERGKLVPDPCIVAHLQRTAAQAVPTQDPPSDNFFGNVAPPQPAAKVTKKAAASKAGPKVGIAPEMVGGG